MQEVSVSADGIADPSISNLEIAIIIFNSRVLLALLLFCASLLYIVHSNWGTEDDPDFSYHNGNKDPKGFGTLVRYITHVPSLWWFHTGTNL